MIATGVGGVPEVLPPDMMITAKPDPDDLLEKVEEGIKRAKAENFPHPEQHEKLSKIYSWDRVAA